MTDCATIRRRLAEEDERSLSATDAEALRTHLAGCASCAAEAKTQHRLIEALGALADLDPSPGFAGRVRRAVFPSRLRLVRWWPAFAAAAAAVLVLLPVLRPSARPQAVPAAVAPAIPDEEIVAHLDLLEHLEIAEGIDVVETRGRLAEIDMILAAAEER